MVDAPPADSRHIYRTLGLGCRAESWVTDLGSLEGGAVDLTVGIAMNRLGYDRDFAEIAAGVLGVLPEAAPVPGWRSIELDPTSRTLRVPLGTLVDLGATAKALTADRIAQRVSVKLGRGVLLSLSWVIPAAGPPPPGGFRIGLADVSRTANSCEPVAIASGGLATSGIMSRRRRLGHHTLHRIVDPSTGLLPMPTWRTATVTAASCVDASAASTAAVVKGATAEGWLTMPVLPSRPVAAAGRFLSVAGWRSVTQ